VNRLKLTTIIILVMLYARSALADGGTVLATAEQDGYRITVLTSPTPLRAGPVDVSVLVQHSDTGTIVDKAEVAVSMRPINGNQLPLRSMATRAAATNKMFRAALFTLPQSGDWRLSTIVTIDDHQLESETDFEAAAALPHFSDLWLWTGWPAIAIGLFVAHRGLVNRSERRDFMKTAAAALICPAAPISIRNRIADYAELVRPRIAILVLFTVAAAFCLASRGAPDWARLLNTVFGTALLVAGASALNQVFERYSDALMIRTANRPLPSGRVKPQAVFLSGMSLAIGGLVYLAVTIRQPTTIVAAAVAFLSYVFVYTPLKPKTSLNTLMGAVSGAIPPVIGWTAAANSVDLPAAVLFAILFLWQVPHFLAIAWIYRDDYARAGLRMLPVVDPRGHRTAICMLGFCVALLLVSAVPSALGWTGPIYLCGATLVGLAFLMSAIGFWRTRSDDQARWVLWASLAYLPALVTVLLAERTFKSL
jgi:heme o synthase